MIKNVLRKAASMDMNLTAPASHPFLPLLPLRASCIAWTNYAAGRRDGDDLVVQPHSAGDGVPEAPVGFGADHRVVTALFEAVWQHGLDASDPAVVLDVLQRAEVPGVDELTPDTCMRRPWFVRLFLAALLCSVLTCV